MNRLTTYALLFLFANVNATTVESDVSTPFSLSIRCDSQVFKPGTDVHVEIVLKNTTNHEIEITRSNGTAQAELYYSITVITELQKMAPETEYGAQLYGRNQTHPVHIFRSDVTYNLKPSEVMVDEVILNKIYDVSHPGKYRIEVSRQIPAKLGSGVVRSNSLQITVKN